jgi:hypothetical protein
MPDPPTEPKFHAMFYNFVAKRIRENFDLGWPGETGVQRVISTANRAVLSDLAMDFAKRFADDNPAFDPIKFLDACSPDSELYPMGELWNLRET